MIHLDTNFLIDALVPGSAQEAQMVGWLSAGEPLGISTVAWGFMPLVAHGLVLAPGASLILSEIAAGRSF